MALLEHVPASLPTATALPTAPATPTPEAPAPAVSLVSSGRSHIGRRPTNQDRFVHDDDLRLYLVADGVSRSADGGAAAELVAEAVREAIGRAHRGHRHGALTLVQATLRAHRRLCRAVRGETELRGMATTLVALYFDTLGRAALVHLGDSRAYRLRAGRLERLTDDHTLLAEALATGILDDEAKAHPAFRNVLTRSLATESLPEIQTTWLDTRPGDLYLLCSDGLSGSIPTEDLRQILLGGGSLEERSVELIDEALDRGASDNVTAVLAQIPGIA